MSDVISGPPDALAAAEAFYAEGDYDLPYIPPALRPKLQQLDEGLWCSEAEPPVGILDLADARADMVENPRDFVLFGVTGYGFNAWYSHYLMQESGLILLTSLHSGPLNETARETLERRTRVVPDLVDLRDRVRAAGAWPGDDRYLLIDDQQTPENSGSGWLAGESAEGRDPWQPGEYVYFAAHSDLMVLQD